MDKKNKLLILSTALVAIIIALISTSYAFFTGNVTGNDEATPTVITSGNLAVTFSDGLEVSKSDMVPGESITKTFSVENTGVGELKYDIYFSEICNLFVNNNDLVYTLTSTNNGYSVLTPTPVPTTPTKLVDSQTIGTGVTQEYTLTITFVNADYDQSNEMGAYFSTKLNINDYKNAEHCSKYNNTVKYYVNNVEVQDIPSNIGYLYSTSNCTNNAEVTWNNEQWNYAVDYDSSTADSVCSINFIPEEYTITYNLDGGTNNSSNPSSYTIETDTITLSNPTKEGYAFNGWTGDNTTIAKGSTGNKTYTATWTDKCASVTYQDGTTCSVTYSQQTGTYNKLAYSSIDSTYRCPAYDQSSGGSSCNGTTNACASGHTSCSLSNCGSYGSCSATYTNETGTKTRTCTQTCKSTYDSSITCSTNTNYQDSTSCTGTTSPCNDGLSVNGAKNFAYTGSVQTFNACAGRKYKLEVWGAQGGSYNSTYYGGNGGYSYGTINMSSNTTLYIYVGGAGTSVTSGTAGGSGGYNGGGKGAIGRDSSKGLGGSGGGGASDIRIASTSLYARVIVAGGGGGSGGPSMCGGSSLNAASTITQGGSGGGISGSTSSYVACTNTLGGYPGNGGTSTAGGTGGTVSKSNTTNTDRTYYPGGGAGGGGGWYGGGGGGGGSANNSSLSAGSSGSSGSFGSGGSGGSAGSSGTAYHSGGGGSGGGGSGYVYTSSTASNYPSGCKLNSSYYLTSSSTNSGTTSFTAPGGGTETGHTGNGYARITRLS